MAGDLTAMKLRFIKSHHLADGQGSLHRCATELESVVCSRQETLKYVTQWVRSVAVLKCVCGGGGGGEGGGGQFGS